MLVLLPDVQVSLHLSHSVLWPKWTISIDSSWIWSRGSTGRGSKGERRVMLGYLFPGWKGFTLSFMGGGGRVLDTGLCTQPYILFLWALPTHIPSGIGVIMCLPITSPRWLDCMIYLYPACTFGNSPFITPSSKFLTCVYHPFLAELWLMQAERTWRLTSVKVLPMPLYPLDFNGS